MNQPDPASDTTNLRARQLAFVAEIDRKATVMNAAALALAMRLNAYAGIELPPAIRESLNEFAHAQQAYLDVALRPADGQQVA